MPELEYVMYAALIAVAIAGGGAMLIGLMRFGPKCPQCGGVLPSANVKRCMHCGQQIVLLMAVLLVAAFTGCGGQDADDERYERALKILLMEVEIAEIHERAVNTAHGEAVDSLSPDEVLKLNSSDEGPVRAKLNAFPPYTKAVGMANEHKPRVDFARDRVRSLNTHRLKYKAKNSASP